MKLQLRDHRLRMSVVAAVAALLLVSGCSHGAAPVRTATAPSTLATQAPDPTPATQLLAKHSLHPVGPPEVGESTIATETKYLGPAEALLQGGLVPLRYEGMRLRSLTFPLRERTAVGGVKAVFLYDGARIVAGYLDLEGYRPPYFPLDKKAVKLRAGS